MTDDEFEESGDAHYEARFLRSLLIRRAIMGVGSITVALAGFAMSSALLYAVLTRSSPGRSPIRLIAAGYLVSVFAGLAGVRILRRGEVDFTDGTVHEGEPVPVRMIAACTAVVATAVCALAAWPLGFYAWVGGNFSKCRELVTVEELSSIAGRTLEAGSLSEASGDTEVCTLRILEGTLPVASINVHEDYWTGGYEFNRRRLEEHEALSGIGDESLRGRGGGFHQLGFLVGVSGAWVQLSETVFDEAQVSAVEALLRERHVLIEPAAR